MVAVTPALINNCPAPRLKTVAILRAGFAGTSVAEVSDVKLPEVMTVDEIARFAVTVPLIAGSDTIVTLFDMDAVTEPIWAVPAASAGSEAMVRLLPIVTDEMDIGTVPLIDAVTEPICAVPATNAGSVVKETG